MTYNLFKVCNIVIWYVYIVQNDYHNKFSQCSSPHSYKLFFLVMRTFKIYSLSNFQIYNKGGVFFKILFIFRQRGREEESKRETSICGCLSSAPYWWPRRQPRHVTWLGIKPVTLWFTGLCSLHWAIPARAQLSNIQYNIVNYSYHVVYYTPKIYLP